MINQDPVQRESLLALYRECVGVIQQIKKAIGINPRKCPICGHEHPTPQAVQEVANRAFIGQ